MKKSILLFLIAISIYSSVSAQIVLPVYPDSAFTTYYHQRVTLFKSLPKTKDDIIFLGNSITDGSEWSEVFNDLHAKNRGISGDITAGVIYRLDEVVQRKPAKIFLMIGVNDLARGIKPDSVVKNIQLIADYIYQESPGTKLYVESVLPVNAKFGKFSTHVNKVEQIKETNKRLAAIASQHHFQFLNLHSRFTDADGNMQFNYTNDGLHLLGAGYMLWKHLVYPYVYDLNEKPSLIPLPKKIIWGTGYFNLYKCNQIIINTDKLKSEATQLKNIMDDAGHSMTIEVRSSTENATPILCPPPTIELNLVEEKITDSNSSEAYTMQVLENKIIIAATTAHGIFNGIQTLRQLMRDNVLIDMCTIEDSPAFSWRGYMIDVGRNYMSVNLLKQQIDKMSQYKLNVFHFHATEDIAWRIAIKEYPQLTSPESMLRNKGKYYSAEEIQELISFCKERHITFVPEIDMPGHSAAFKRAMKVDMQSDSGIVYLKNILQEICTTYDVPFIHIGADEVKITNKNFIPEISSYITSFGKKLIGWQPGGNFNPNTIRQLWMDDNAHSVDSKDLEMIDSRHLYLNHMDPLESVVTIYNRKIGKVDAQTKNVIGATICMWHDRAVANEDDILKMNPVYPGMLAFAERSWLGGGKTAWISNISDGDVQSFTSFEQRLLDNKKQNFATLPFPYVKQSNLEWTLLGPFSNDG
ncbi:MAG: hypothetical protein RIR55_664, partial [Bacteroidota bacterium]